MLVPVAVKTALTIWLAAIAIRDLRAGLIPNTWVVPVWWAAGLWQLGHGRWWLLAAWAFLYVLWRLHIMGGGDAKLLMALIALFPSEQFVLVFSAGVVVLGLGILVCEAIRRAIRLAQTAGEIPLALATVLAPSFQLPQPGDLDRHGRRSAWVFSLAAGVYLWLFW